MKWFNVWLANSLTKGLELKKQQEEAQWLQENKKMAIGQAVLAERGSPEGEDTIRFELSSAVGGKILSVRRYDPRTDRQSSQTYVIPTGEDLGERVAKILNLEQYK